MSAFQTTAIPGVHPETTKEAIVRFHHPVGCYAIDKQTREKIDEGESIYWMTLRLRDKGYTWIVDHLT